jgi:hypothetical protein
MSTVSDPTPERVAEVVPGLTGPQITRLHGVAELRARGLSWASRYGDISIRTSRATTAALLQRGLLRDDDGSAALTPLGIAVRTALTEASND